MFAGLAKLRRPSRMVALLAAILIAVGAQMALANGSIGLGVFGFSAAVACTILGAQPLPSTNFVSRGVRPLLGGWRCWLIFPALIAGAVTFSASAGNRYRPGNVVPWIASMLLGLVACAELWPGCWRLNPRAMLAGLRRRLSPTSVAMIATLLVILAIGAAFRFAELRELPRDMIFDHPQKLLDVNDVLSGTPSIFFERNTGREPWQFYWTVALIKLFNLYIDYFTLKLGTSLIGWLMLPAVFLLAREIFGTRTALLATLFAAVASWGVLGARYGLRYPLAPCATAWTMYFLVRGLRRDERNAMITAGVWLGIGLQGYTAYRFMLPVFVLLVLFWATWQYARRQRPAAARALVNGGLALVLALLVMMPLVRYGTEHADRLFYRANTRLTSLARPIQGSVPLIFLSNVGKVLLMFNYTSDDTWVVNIRFKPAVDIVLAGLIVIGATGALVASVRSRDPWPAVILGAGILMLMPSALSIAFPKENPSLVRTGGAIPMIMTICAVAPGMLIEQARQRQAWLRAATIALVGLVAVAIVAINYQRAFVEYRVKYCQNVQNSADISGEMQAFIDAGNPRENVWLVGYDNWVDYRAVGIGIGDIHFQNRVVGPSAATAVDLHGRPALFALNRADNATLVALAKKYPMGTARVVPIADCPEKNFVLMTIPSSITHN